jgi:2,5-diamino-6-(ribosylamino)-4(3H)-pyrimidinone 5'-phosphate reductase
MPIQGVMRPYTIINAAMSADGKISSSVRKQVRISGKNDLARVDQMRADADAVMVGIGTVLADNPSLTVKSERLRLDRKQRYGCENPVRIVVDSMARTPNDADIFNKGEGKRFIAVCENAPIKRVEKLMEKAEVITIGKQSVDLVGLMARLKDMGMDTLMVEGGATLNWSLVSQGLVDEIYTYIGCMIFGGKNAPTLIDGTGFSDYKDAVKLELFSMEKIDNGALLQWRVS